MGLTASRVSRSSLMWKGPSSSSLPGASSVYKRLTREQLGIFKRREGGYIPSHGLTRPNRRAAQGQGQCVGIPGMRAADSDSGAGLWEAREGGRPKVLSARRLGTKSRVHPPPHHSPPPFGSFGTGPRKAISTDYKASKRPPVRGKERAGTLIRRTEGRPGGGTQAIGGGGTGRGTWKARALTARLLRAVTRGGGGMARGDELASTRDASHPQGKRGMIPILPWRGILSKLVDFYGSASSASCLGFT